ncbi:hypothetical protein JOC85_000547 [Bacillus mesophilus]|nr:hypothetical protein [Bacillus mesophilus]
MTVDFVGSFFVRYCIAGYDDNLIKYSKINEFGIFDELITYTIIITKVYIAI